MATPIDSVRMSGAMPLPSDPFPGQTNAKVTDNAVFFAVPARLFTVLLGLVAIAWGTMTLPTFWRQLPIQRTADAIVDRDPFKPHAFDLLLPVVAQIEQSDYCRPEALRSAAIIRLRLAEDAMASGERDALDARLVALQDTVRRSLACTPGDSFLWMILTWLDGTREGFQPAQLTYLRLSYQFGPNEGWVAARRNRLALAMFARLPTDLADDAVKEFSRMVDSWIYWDSIAIFTGPGWPFRERLLASLKDVGQRQREAFYSELYTQGYKVVVPGVAPREPRPWY
jgi:hypothetical protein